MAVPWDKEEKGTLTSHFEIFVLFDFFQKWLHYFHNFNINLFPKKKERKEKEKETSSLTSSFETEPREGKALSQVALCSQPGLRPYPLCPFTRLLPRHAAWPARLNRPTRESGTPFPGQERPLRGVWPDLREQSLIPKTGVGSRFGHLAGWPALVRDPALLQAPQAQSYQGWE